MSEVGGRKLRKSFCQGSDQIKDFPCSYCTKEGNNVAAIKHCVECDENLCKTCLDHHNKFAVMRGHQLLDKVKSPSGKMLELPNQRCDKHGKLIDVYCPGHDKVGCSTCMIVEHSGCQGISFIPDRATERDTSEKITLLKADISTLQSRFEALKQTLQNDLKTTKYEKDQLLKEIKLERKIINDQLDKMEAELLQEVDEIFQTKLKNIESNLTEVDTKITLLQENLNKVDDAKLENASERYVQINLAKEKTMHVRLCLESFDRSCGKESVRFHPYEHLYDSRCNIIGKFIRFQDVKVESCCNEFNVRIDGDKRPCWITSMCLCKDGGIALTDYRNKFVKILNESFKIRASLTTGDGPAGICQIDQSLLVVTLPNSRRVQFISQKEPMKLQQWFKVGDRCRGIAYSDGLIYVCCGGSKENEEEGAGHLDVYSVSGVLLTSYHGGIECPIYVSISRSTMEIFVVDGYKGVMIIDNNRSIKNITLNDKSFSEPQCMCWISENRYCIPCYKSGRFLQISCDGIDQKELVAQKSGTTKVIGMCFDSKTSKLAVSSSESDKIRVYNLKTGDMSC